MEKTKFCIVGTAPSWKMTPWSDPAMHIASLNDAYQLKGFVRADEWYDTHPIDKMFFTTRPLAQHEVPPGHYVRPAGHLEWLSKQQGPVWLHPDHATQYPESANWPHARPLPWAQIQDHFGRYFGSGPSLMMAHAILRGFKHFEIYGIHLSTEFEYMKQRPNFEFLCGRILGDGKVTHTVVNGVRRYETQNGVVMMPEASPVLQADFIYGLEPRPDGHLAPLQWDMHRYTIKRNRAVEGLITRPWWKSAKPLREELALREAQIHDTREQLQRYDVLANWK